VRFLGLHHVKVQVLHGNGGDSRCAGEVGEDAGPPEAKPIHQRIAEDGRHDRRDGQGRTDDSDPGCAAGGLQNEPRSRHSGERPTCEMALAPSKAKIGRRSAVAGSSLYRVTGSARPGRAPPRSRFP
jgi:hypothetical protein